MRAEPGHGSIDAPLFVGAHEVHAVVGFARTEDRNLGHTVAVWNVILDEHLAESVGRCEGVNVPVVVVRADFGDDGDLAFWTERFALPITSFNDGHEQAEVNLSISRQSCTAVGGCDGVNRHVHGAHVIQSIGAVHGHASIDVLVVVGKFRPFPRLGVDVGGIATSDDRIVFTHAPGKHAGGEEQHHEHRLEVHDTTGDERCFESIGNLRFSFLRCLRLLEPRVQPELRPCQVPEVCLQGHGVHLLEGRRAA